MTTRFHHLTVVLEESVADESAISLIEVILQLPGVASVNGVEPIPAGIGGATFRHSPRSQRRLGARFAYVAQRLQDQRSMEDRAQKQLPDVPSTARQVAQDFAAGLLMLKEAPLGHLGCNVAVEATEAGELLVRLTPNTAAGVQLLKHALRHLDAA